MKRKQFLSSKILAKTTRVPTELSRDSYPSGETLTTPYVRDNELLQCEVNIQYINDIIHLRMDLSRSRYQRPAIKKFFINIGKSKEILKKVNANHYRQKSHDSGSTSASGCRLLNGASISIFQFCLSFSYCLGAFTR